MARKEYLGGVSSTTLASDITSGATSLSVASGGGADFPTASTHPFVIVVDRGTANEELMLCTARTNDTFTVTRAYDSTTAVSHTANAVVEHCIDADIINKASELISKATSAGDIVYWSAAETPERLAKGTSGQFLKQGASAPSWASLASADVSDLAEYIADTVGAMVTGNTETGITVTFQDSDNTLDFEVTGSGPTIVRKTADESVTSSSTLQDDNHLTFTCAAGTTRVGEVVLFVASGAEAADIVAKMVTSTGSIFYGSAGLVSTVTTPEGDGAFLATGSGGLGHGIDGTFDTMIIIKFSVTAGGSDATVKLQWAQGVSNATGTTVKAGSYLTHQLAS